MAPGILRRGNRHPSHLRSPGSSGSSWFHRRRGRRSAPVRAGVAPGAGGSGGCDPAATPGAGLRQQRRVRPACAAPGGRAALGPPAAAAAARPAQRPAARGALPIRPARPHRLSGALARSPAARTGSTAAGRAPPLCDTHPMARRRSRRPPIRPGRRRRRLLGAGFLRVRWRPSVGSGPDVDPL